MEIGDFVRHTDGSKGIILEKEDQRIVNTWRKTKTVSWYNFRILWTTGHVSWVNGNFLSIISGRTQ